MKFAVLPFAALFAVAAPALEVVYDSRTPAECREWGERFFVREQMEVLGAKICKALYGGTRNENLHEGFRIALYLAPTKGGNPAFASGRRITWKVGPNPGGNVAVASLGAAREKSGKALLLVAGSKRDTLSAHVVASVPGVGYGIVSTKAISVLAIESKPHSIVMSVRGGGQMRRAMRSLSFRWS